MENRWQYFTVDHYDGEVVDGLKKLKKKYASVWWSFYPKHMRLGIFSGVNGLRVKEDVTVAFCDTIVDEIDNPDSEEHPEDIVEELNQIKLNACNLVTKFGYKTPEVRVNRYWSLFIHLFMNAMGAGYQDEAEILAWNVNQALTLQRKINKGEETE